MSNDLPVGSVARCKYQFTSEHPSELGLAAGELVTILEESKMDWSYCSRVNKPSEKGCAPTNYLELVTAPKSAGGGGGYSASNQNNNNDIVNSNPTSSRSNYNSGRGGTPSRQQGNNTSNNTRASPVPNISGLQQQNTSSSSATRRNINTSSYSSQPTSHNNPRAPSTQALINITPDQTSLMEGFQKNELYFQQLLAQRTEATSNLDAALREAAQEIDLAKEKHASMSRRLKELDNTITKERKRWKDRVEEERMLLAQRSGGGGGGGGASSQQQDGVNNNNNAVVSSGSNNNNTRSYNSYAGGSGSRGTPQPYGARR